MLGGFLESICPAAFCSCGTTLRKVSDLLKFAEPEAGLEG